MKYQAIIPFIPSMGTVSPINCDDKFYDTKEEQVLWQLNSMREHDGLSPFVHLPQGIKFVILEH